MSTVAKTSYVWLDGALVPWDAANVHVLTHTLHYGLGAFEGIRCYAGRERSYVFRLREHIQRLLASCHMVLMDVPFSEQALVQACLDTVAANRLQEAYLRPIVFMGAGEMGVGSTSNPVRVSIAAWVWGKYLGREGYDHGIRCRVSAYRRLSNQGFLAKGKICGQYVNSILAKREALASGYQEAIMLDEEGYVAEATGENLFIVKNGRLRTPPYGSPILGGITRDSVLRLAKHLGIQCEEARFARDELYTADEVFLTGTAAEVTPVREVDHRRVGDGSVGPVTQKLRELYMSAVVGAQASFSEWLSVVPSQSSVVPAIA